MRYCVYHNASLCLTSSQEMGKAPRGGALSLKGPFHRDSETNDLPNAPSPRSRASASGRISTIQLSHTPARLAIEGSGQGVWHILGRRGRLRGAFSRGCLGSGTTSAHERSAPKGIYAIKPDHRLRGLCLPDRDGLRLPEKGVPPLRTPHLLPRSGPGPL